MSHLAIIETQIRDLEVAKAAAQALGIPVAEGGTVHTVYARFGKRSHPCALVFGAPTLAYNPGLQAQESGAYALICDNYDLQFMPGGRDLLLRLGPSMLQWAYGTPEGADRAGHIMTGRPTRYLQEYALQTGLRVGQQYGMSAARVPCDPVEDDAPDGGEKVVLTGGYLPAHMSMHLVACPDGTCRVRFDGATDSSCYEHTKPLEDALGQLLTNYDLSTIATCHVRQAATVTHLAR